MTDWRRIALLIGIMVLVGAVRVSQQTALRLRAYALGRQQRQLATLENESLWLNAQVIGLQSPARLAATMQAEHRQLVARSTLPATPSRTQVADAE